MRAIRSLAKLGGALAVLALLMTPARVHARCLNPQCTPVYDAHIICCNELVYTPGVEGFGADRTVDCDDYIRNRATPEARRSICIQLRDSLAPSCPAAAQACPGNTPTGNDCPENMPVPQRDRLYAYNRGGTSRLPLYDAPGGKRTAFGPSWGTQLRYTQMTTVNGETWYYIDNPGGHREWETEGSDMQGYSTKKRHVEDVTGFKGWVRAKDVSCSRPGDPPPSARYDPTGWSDCLCVRN